ncbi:MAG: response regulator [Melioribacteraceae bacterium]|nr:response regulator [Melioribacteraceae bacterium]
MKSFFKNKKSDEKFDKNNLTQFKSFIDYSSSPFFRAKLNGEFLYVNQAFAKLLSYFSKSDLLKLNFKEDLFSNTENWENFLNQLKRKKRLEDFEIKLLSKSEEIISINIDVRIVDEDSNSSYFEGIIAKRIVVDNNKDLERELEELREKERTAASQVNKANYTKNVKSQYLANMTHEIKTPINSIVGFLTLIEQKLFESEEELQDFAHNARISADSLLEIINNILDISRIEAGKVELDEIEFSLSKEIEKAKAIALPAGGSSNIEVSTKISDDINNELIGDPLRYRQVLINILSNSVKYTDEGNIDIIVEIEKVRESSCSIRTIVKDTGSGIPKEQLSLLFKPYTQVKTKKWNKKDGSGLGLMICKEIVKLMDGEIIIKSKEGKGTIVEFTTLFKTTKNFLRPDVKEDVNKSSSNEDVKSEKIESKSEKTEKEEIDKNEVVAKEIIKEERVVKDIVLNKPPQNGGAKSRVIEEVNSSDFIEEPRTDIKRILLVEDNPISQKVELRLLKESGYNVEAVSNGFDAIEAVKTDSFNLVLMDVEMAEMNGLESTKRIRALDPPTGKIPIIAVTAHSSMKDREKCLASGMDDYIAKPININFMKMTIDHWLLKAVEI